MTPILLHVEDDPCDVRFFRRALARLGASWEVQIACDGREALERLSSAMPPTHVVLDLKLPKLSGLDVLTWIRGRPSTAALPVIVLTSSSEPSDMVRARSLGVDDYLIKPVAFDRLLMVVEKIVRRWEIPTALQP